MPVPTYVCVSRLEEKADGAQCVDLAECIVTRALCIDKHTKMTTRDTGLTNAALRELDMHLSVQQHHQTTKNATRHIVKLHGYHLQGDRLHLIQEYCARGDLLAVMRHEIRMQKAGFGVPVAALNTVSEDGIRKIFAQILHGVTALHDAEIAHLDLSLENVFLTDDDQVRVGDLGLAERFHCTRNGRILHQCPQGIAKVAYAAPEIHASFVAGIPIDVSKADSWALGVVLWQLWTKQALFQTLPREDQLFHQMEQVGSAKALNACPLLGDAPKELKDLLGKLLDINPCTRLNVRDVLQHSWFFANAAAPTSPPKLKRVTSDAMQHSQKTMTSTGLSTASPTVSKGKARSGSCGGEIVLERTRVSIRGSTTSPAMSPCVRS